MPHPAWPESTPPPVHLRAGGVSVVVDTSTAIPRILHWGAEATLTSGDLELLRQHADTIRAAEGVQGPIAPSVVPLPSEGWIGTPGLEGHRGGRRFSPAFVRTAVQTGPVVAGSPASDSDPGQESGRFVLASAEDLESGLALDIRIELLHTGLLRASAELRNTGDDSYDVDALSVLLPVPNEAAELLDFAGRHLRERSPQRAPFGVGSHVREGRRGRTGSDAAFVLVAGARGFGFRDGEAWGVHVAWSGNHRTMAELGLNGSRVVGGGELLLPGEVILAPGESYRTPVVYGSYGRGLDDLAGRFHEWLRSRPQHPRGDRPVVLNTWEAVYFRQDLESLVELAERGARVGAERFVLDDGWFRGRRDDTAGLGDWQVDEDVWPDGLQPLVDAVERLGMDFGLWFEPEMINEDSDLARAHPDWILAPGERLPLPGRNQQVLDVAHPEAYAYLLEAISGLVSRYRIAYLKWDHNRDLLEAGDRATGTASVHRQTAAVYRLIDELRVRHPGLEIESCSSGGGRVDLGILERTDRVWASDCIDALERQRIQRWTGQLIPPELVGSHVGAPVAHTTKRSHSLAFRAATAVFGSFGIEWDLRSASDAELDELAAWIELYKRERDLVHRGRVVRGDHPEESYWVHGVVSDDATRGLFAFVAMDTSVSAHPGRVRLPGLREDLGYRISPVELSAGALVRTAAGQPAWTRSTTPASGAALSHVGLQAPRLYPEQAFLFRVDAEPADPSARP